MRRRFGKAGIRERRGEPVSHVSLTFTQAQIQARYNTHRMNRNEQQKAKLLAPEFPGVTVDEILAKLENTTTEPGFKDWRHCLVFWARPPEKVRSLIAEIQQRLLTVVPRMAIYTVVSIGTLLLTL